jgi:ubiquitin-conjugating enzyme E2 G1
VAGRESPTGVCTSVGDVSSRAGHSPLLYTAGSNLFFERRSLAAETMSANSSRAALLLTRQLRDLNKSSVDGFSAGLVSEDDPFRWAVTVLGPPDTPFEGGLFRAELTFPPEYPMLPPRMRFLPPIPWHPNVYRNGEVCISILHPPGDDPHGYEMAGERWSPVHTVESILLSVISMLASPNDESPANIDAAKEWREQPDAYRRRVRSLVRQTLEES